LLDFFDFKQAGVGEGGRVVGTIVPTGAVPKCFRELQSSGVPVNLSIFEAGS
jgi:hypothetical protein